ncbi:MAG: class E sortase [Candidatus Pacebacteria bacterium]|jgi:sortase A|nr:class E sortase [Candidatus Paceibacterota bacterium]MBP9780580.1 class E sortase [Candidatus Paceibacterota bacterium]MDQ5949736.1 sortase [Patescibacteria group bacterium]
MNEKLYKRAKRLIIINDILRYVGIIFTIIILLTPYFPEISFLLHNDSKKNTEQTELPNEITMAIKNGIDYLYIPAIGVSESIIEADNIGQVHERVWRRPKTSNPKDGGNTVLVAHRYATIGGNRASTFYHLPKLVAGDKIYVVWDGILYTYGVETTETVLPTEIAIESPTPDARLTLYTCTPLWTASHRYVVHAVPILPAQ